MEVSVVIPCLCEERNIEKCLESLINQDFTGRYEIVVVDNNSKDRTQMIINAVMQRHTNIRLIVETKRGTAVGRNTGIKNARYDYIAFIDADCEAPPDWLSTLARNYQTIKAKCDSLIGVGGRNIAPTDASPFVRGIEIVLDSYLGSFNSIQGRQFKTPKFVTSLSMTNALYERKKIMEIGGFDESLKSEAEDAEINHRLHSSGNKFLFIPDSFVWHKMRPSPKSWFRNMFRYGKGRARLLKRHPGMWRASYLLPIVFILAILSIPLAFFSRVFFLPLLYFPLMAAISLYQAHKKKSLGLLGPVILIYVIQHFGYALGEVYGLLHPKVK